MADLEKTVSIIFGGVDRTSEVISGIDRRMDDFSGKVQDISGPLADVADNILTLDAALAALAVGGLALSVREAGNFGTAFAEIVTLTGQTAQDLGDFRGDILDYSRDSGSAIESINAAIYSAISAGTDYADSLGLIKQSEQLAVAGKADLNATTVLLASTLNAYGESTDQAQRYSDVFFETVKLGQTTLPELASSLSQVTGIAAAGDVPIETLTAAVAALTAQGMPTSQAMTALKAALSNIISPSSQAADMAESLGLKFNATALKTQGFEGILRDVQTATGGNIEKMATLFGSTEALNAVTTLATDRSGKFKDALEAMSTATGSTATAYATMADNFDQINTRLINNIRATLIDVGEPLLGRYGEIAAGLGEIFEGISIGIDQGAFDSVIETIQNFAGELAVSLRSIAQNLPDALSQVDFSNFLNALGNLREEFEGIFDGVDLSTPEGLAEVIQFVTDSITSLTRVTIGMVEAFSPVIRTIVDTIDQFNGLDAATQETAGNVLGIGRVVDTLIGTFDAFRGMLTAVTTAALTVAGTSGIGAIARALGLTAVPLAGFATALGVTGAAGAVVALGYAITEASDWVYEKLNPALASIPGATPVTLTLDDGNVLDLMDGIVRDAQGRTISVPVDLDVQEPTGAVDQRVLEALETGQSDAEIAYLLTGNVDHLREALREAGVLVEQKADEVKTTMERLFVTLEDGSTIEIEVPINQGTLDATKAKIDQLPAEKELEIKLKGEIDQEVARIKGQADVLEASFKFAAEIETARLETDARRIEAIAGTISAVFETSAQVIGDSFGVLENPNLWGAERSRVWDVIRQEQEIRMGEYEVQRALAEAEIRLNEARAEAYDRGEIALRIQADGLNPHMQAFMWELLSEIQVHANEEQAEFLLGL